jgi:hypothetical protein
VKIACCNSLALPCKKDFVQHILSWWLEFTWRFVRLGADKVCALLHCSGIQKSWIWSQVIHIAFSNYNLVYIAIRKCKFRYFILLINNKVLLLMVCFVIFFWIRFRNLLLLTELQPQPESSWICNFSKSLISWLLSQLIRLPIVIANIFSIFIFCWFQQSCCRTTALVNIIHILVICSNFEPYRCTCFWKSHYFKCWFSGLF